MIQEQHHGRRKAEAPTTPGSPYLRRKDELPLEEGARGTEWTVPCIRAEGPFQGNKGIRRSVCALAPMGAEEVTLVQEASGRMDFCLKCVFGRVG